MNPHFFTAPFCVHLVQGSWFKALVAASPLFYWDDARKRHLSYQSLVTPTTDEGRNRLTCVVSDPSAQSPLVLAGAFHT